ncbi:MAG: PEGA domain-containing protein [Spirochaetia bacterium]|nr:PEGA domain-containing protein [Spirochaetia bacterium]
MHRLALLVFLASVTSIVAQPVLLRPIQIEGQDAKLRDLAKSIEKDLFDVLTGKGLQIVSESTLKSEERGVISGSCTDACILSLAKRTNFTRVLVPILQKKKDSENFLCYLYTVQEGRITENNVLVLFINLPESRRKAAIASVMVELFPGTASVAPAASRDLPTPPKVKQSAGSIRLVSDPVGASVFVDGIQVGVTPFDLVNNGKMQSVRIAMSNYEEIVLPIRASAQSEIMFTLQKLESRNAATDQATRQSASATKGPYWGAFARSLILPGWGQYSKGDESAFWFGLGSAVFAGSAVYADGQARNLRHRIVAPNKLSSIFFLASSESQSVSTAAVALYLIVPSAGSPSNLGGCRSSICKSYRQLDEASRVSAGMFGAMYLWGLLDALLASVPAKKSNSFSFRAMPVFAGNDRGALFAARMRF